MIKLYPYQKEFVEEVKKGNSVIGNWARRAGKSFSLGVAILETRPKKYFFPIFVK